MTDDARDAQALRLVKAFMKIQDFDARSIIVRLTEAAARGASVKTENLDLLARSGPEKTKPN